MTLAIILLWIGTSFIVGLAVYGGFRLLTDIESFVAGQLAEDALGDGANGDWPAVPDDLKAFHSATITETGQHDHA